MNPESSTSRRARRIDLRSLPLPPPELEIVVRSAPNPGTAGPVVVAVRGELDMATTAQLQGCLDSLVHAGHLRLRLELRELTFCDVAGLSVLLRIGRALRGAGGELMLADPPRSLQRIVGALNLAEAFALRSDG